MRKVVHQISWLCFITLLLSPFSLIADSHQADSPTFKTTELTSNIKMLQGKGGNIALLTGPQGILMVDDDYKQMSEVLKKEVAKYGGLDQLTYVVNTHWHGDHTQGNMAFGPHAQIVAHDNVRARLLTRQEIKLFKMVSEPYPESALPSITYQQAMKLHFNGEEIALVHYANGHTDGDSVVFFKKANVVHMGDHYFSGFFPFVDLTSGGNVITLAKNIKKILTQIDDKTQVIPGHGPLSSKVDLQAYHDMLVGTADEVKMMKGKGMSLADIKKAGLSDKWQSWTKGFIPMDVWIGTVHDSL